MKTWLIVLICTAYFLVNLAWCQIAASGYIGCRSFSSFYETHFLFRKKRLCKLIPYKPKHFGRYTFYEVFNFFYSCFQLVPVSIIILVYCFGCENYTFFGIYFNANFVFIVLFNVIVCIINDIGSHFDEKKEFYPESEKINLSGNEDKIEIIDDTEEKSAKEIIKINNLNKEYYTIYDLWQSYYIEMRTANAEEKKDSINSKYIKYFKNIKNLVVKKEYKSGKLLMEIKNGKG